MPRLLLFDLRGDNDEKNNKLYYNFMYDDIDLWMCR